MTFQIQCRQPDECSIIGESPLVTNMVNELVDISYDGATTMKLTNRIQTHESNDLPSVIMASYIKNIALLIGADIRRIRLLLTSF